MSRIGKRPVELPKGVDVSVTGNSVRVKGPKGDLTLDAHPEMKVTVQEGVLLVERPSDNPGHKALHGLTRTLIANMVGGVTQGYQKTLEIVGVGYKAEKSGKGIKLTVGFSHVVQYDAPPGIAIETPEPDDRRDFRGRQANGWSGSCGDPPGPGPQSPTRARGSGTRESKSRRKAGKTAGA